MEVAKVKKKGFTVVELLTVIVIIGIMAAIAIPTVTGIIQKSRKQYYKTVEDNLKLAGIDYYSKNSKNRPKNRLDSATVSLKDLSNGSYIKDVVDHKGNACDIEKSKVVITKNANGKYDYQACLVCGEEYQTDNAICADDYNPSNNANYSILAV